MGKQAADFTDIHKQRILDVAMRFPAIVELSVRNTSGKTYTLSVVVPGAIPVTQTVVRLHRTAHKVFWKLVAAAQDFLKLLKLIYAPQPLLLLPATVGVTSPGRVEQQKLVAAAARLPVKAETSKVAAYDWKARKEQSDAIPEKRYNNRWDAARAKPGQDGGNPRRKMGLA